MGATSRDRASRRRHPLLMSCLAAALLLGGRCYEKRDYSPTAPPTAQALTLTTESQGTTLPADGVSRLRLVARIDPAADADKRTVLFSGTAGTLVGTANSDGKVAVPADGNGVATIELQSSQQVGSSVVTAEVQNVPGLTRTLVITFVAADPDALLRFVAAPASAPADGATVSSFVVRLAPALPLGTTVRFETTAGVFLPEATASVQRVTDASYTATADLRSASAIGPARVTATAQNVSRQATIDFHRAHADHVTVSTNGVFQVPATATASLAVTGTFLRDVGRVTPGAVATFRATTDTGAPIGAFRDVTTVSADSTGTAGVATATFLPGVTPYRGRVTITVGAAGSPVTGTTQIEIVAPP
jgi:hypothetical protein